MRRARVSQLSSVMLLEPTRITSSTSSRATFFSTGTASATSAALRRPEGVLAIVPPVATTLTRGKRSCAAAIVAKNAAATARAFTTLLPGAVVDRVFEGGARHRHVPFDGPIVGVVVALARVRLRRGVQQAPGLELLGLEQAAGLADEVVDVGPRILLDLLHRPRLRVEHLLQRRAVEVLARRLGARRVRLDQ